MSDDLLSGLESSAVPERAEAARSLGERGDLSAVLPLIDLARNDKSRSVKLNAAAAAADVLARHRGAAGQERVPTALAEAILAALAPVDPGSLPTLLLCYAAFPQTPVIKRLMRMLRDLRVDVRRAAGTAVRRMALSAAAVDEGPGLREWVGDTLDHRKLPMDVAIDLIRLIGQAGWSLLRPRVEAARGRDGMLADVVEQALERLDLRLQPDSWAGVWIDEGLDVLEPGAPSSGEWLSIGTPALEGGWARLEHGLARRIWAPRIGAEGEFEAVQTAGRTWWKLTPDRAVDLVVQEDRRLAHMPHVVSTLQPMLEAIQGQASMRALALLLARTGHAAQAIAILEQPLSGKRPRNDLFFIRGLARVASGDQVGATEDLERYLSKAKRAEPWVEEARALLG